MADKIMLCKYRVPSLIFMMGSEKIRMDATNVLEIEKIDSYDFNIRSILRISLRIDVRKKLWLMKNKRNITCKFALDRIGVDSISEDFMTGSENIWNEEFGIYFNDEDENSDTSILQERIAKNEDLDFFANDIEHESYFDSQNSIDVYLFNRTLLNASNKTVNRVITSGLIQDCVGLILTDSKHPRKVLMSKFENNEVYKELVCPSLSAYEAIAYMDQYYGFFKKGSIIYYDVDYLYIINANGKVTAKRNNEWAEVTFLVKKLDISTPGNGMVRKTGESRYYMSINESCVDPQNYSNVNNANNGSGATVVATDNITIQSATATQTYTDQRNDQTVYTDSGDSKYVSNMIKARMEENECVLYITADNLDVDAFRPNKSFQIVFDDTSKQQKYGQYKYRIAYAHTLFKAESEEYMKASHQIALKRAPENDDATTITTSTNTNSSTYITVY